MLIKYFTKNPFRNGLIFFLWLIFYLPAQAEEIRYFLEDPVDENVLSPLDCGHVFDYGGKCKFKYKADMSKLEQLEHYHIAYYKEGKLTRSIKVINTPDFHPDTGKILIIGRMEFDPNERLILEETLPNNFWWMSYFLKKIIYRGKTREIYISNGDGKLWLSEITKYKEGKAFKTLHYDDQGNSIGYGIHNYKKWTTKFFTSDHKPNGGLDEKTDLPWLDD